MLPNFFIFRQEFLLPLMSSQNVEIGWRAFKCLTAYCIFEKKFAEEHLKTICIPVRKKSKQYYIRLYLLLRL